MSRTFEVLGRMQEDLDLFRVPSVIKALPATGSETDGKISLTDVETFTLAEVLRLVQRLFFATDANDRNGPRRVVFCGIDDGAGCKLLCAEVGRCLARQVQSQVCVMDANVRVPSHISLFDLLPCDSLPDAEDSNAQRVLRRVADNLCVVSPLSVPGQETLTLDQGRVLIRNLSDQFAYVVISAPPIGLYGDAALLGQMVDGVVLVLEANSTRRVTAKKAKQALEAANVRILGTVLNNRTFPIPERIYRLL
jgi:Mrp family chromosome partitioning ATPase